jgi:hypothetical protein
MVPLWRPLEKKKSLCQDKHSASARVNNFFHFTYPAVLVGPPPGQITPLTYPPTDFLWVARQTGLAGYFSRSAKFLCMGKQKNRLTATKRRNHFARIFDMRAHMNKPTTASRMVLTRLSYDACGRQESRICMRSRVGSFSSYPVPPDELQGRQVSSYPIPPRFRYRVGRFSATLECYPRPNHTSAHQPSAWYRVGRNLATLYRQTTYPDAPRLRYRVGRFPATLERYPIPGRQIPPC